MCLNYAMQSLRQGNMSFESTDVLEQRNKLLAFGYFRNGGPIMNQWNKQPTLSSPGIGSLPLPLSQAFAQMGLENCCGSLSKQDVVTFTATCHDPSTTTTTITTITCGCGCV
jgi:hypothetical protein